MSAANSFLVSGGPLYPFPCLCDGFFVLLEHLQFLGWYHSLCEFIWASPLLFGKCCFLEFIYHPWLLKSLCLLFHIDPWPLKEEVWLKIFHLWLSTPKYLNYFLHSVQLWVCILINISWKMKLLQWGWESNLFIASWIVKWYSHYRNRCNRCSIFFFQRL